MGFSPNGRPTAPFESTTSHDSEDQVPTGAPTQGPQRSRSSPGDAALARERQYPQSATLVQRRRPAPVHGVRMVNRYPTGMAGRRSRSSGFFLLQPKKGQSSCKGSDPEGRRARLAGVGSTAPFQTRVVRQLSASGRLMTNRRWYRPGPANDGMTTRSGDGARPLRVVTVRGKQAFGIGSVMACADRISALSSP